MNPRRQFPFDLAALLVSPVMVAAVALGMGSLFPAIHWLRRPTADVWLLVLWVAVGASLLGTVLLFLAKLPQYRAGVFFRAGSHDLPPRQQRLYRAAWWLLGPSIFALIILLTTLSRIQ